MKISLRFLAVAMLIFGSRADAQIALRVFKNTSTPATVALGDTFSFSAFIKNDSTSAFIGVVSFNYSINGTSYATTYDSTGIKFDTSFTNVVIAPGDSISRYLRVNVSQPQFNVGPSVVVIWPRVSAGTNAFAADSLVLSFNITPPVGIEDLNESDIKLYLLNNSLVIEGMPELSLKQVRILDIRGREVVSVPNPADNTTLPEMSSGFYIAEVTYNGNKRKTLRFYR